jgi:AraC family transcriptional regulator, transcriptional activator of pobA
MRGYLSQTAKGDVPYIQDLESFYKFINARPPLSKDFDIREIDPEVLKNYDFVAQPFRHSFYCITLFLQGDITLSSGFWNVRLKKPAIYFKTPWQVVSWQKPEKWLKEYFIVFTEKFLADHKLLGDIIFDLPFFQLEKAIPFEIEQEEVDLLGGIYKQIFKEYRSENKDKFVLISSYVHTLLLHVQRLYHKYTVTDDKLTSHINEHEHSLVENFRKLIRQKIANGETNNRHLTVGHLASLLSTHPNHLNAVVKRQKQKTASAFLHEHLLHEAQSLLNQTEFNIKEIAFRLGFVDSSHFNNFFKKQTGETPVAYRKKLLRGILQ